MPLETIAIQDYHAPLIKKPSTDNELKTRLTKLYDNTHEFADGEAAVAFFAQQFAQGNLLYVGMFNDKPIAAIGCFDDGQTNSRRLQYIIVHPENRGRGIAAKLIKQVCDAEIKKGVTSFVPGCPAIHKVLARYELLTVKN